MRPLSISIYIMFTTVAFWPLLSRDAAAQIAAESAPPLTTRLVTSMAPRYESVQPASTTAS